MTIRMLQPKKLKKEIRSSQAVALVTTLPQDLQEVDPHWLRRVVGQVQRSKRLMKLLLV